MTVDHCTLMYWRRHGGRSRRMNGFSPNRRAVLAGNCNGQGSGSESTTAGVSEEASDARQVAADPLPSAARAATSGETLAAAPRRRMPSETPPLAILATGAVVQYESGGEGGVAERVAGYRWRGGRAGCCPTTALEPQRAGGTVTAGGGEHVRCHKWRQVPYVGTTRELTIPSRRPCKDVAAFFHSPTCVRFECQRTNFLCKMHAATTTGVHDRGLPRPHRLAARDPVPISS